MNTRALVILTFFIACLILTGRAAALETTVIQSGADNDEIMKGRTFTVQSTGWTGSCTTATLSFTGCSSCSLSGENAQKTVGGGSSTVSWTTASASQLASAQSVTVSLSGGCTSQQDDSDPFDIVLPPSLSIAASTETSSVSEGGTFSSNINIVNSGETTARNVDVDVTGTGISLQSGCSVYEIEEGSNVGDTCVVKASTYGTQTVTFTVSASNADSASDSFSMSVTDGGDGGNGDGQSPPGGGPAFGPGPSAKNATRRPELVPGVGLRNNLKLQTTLQNMLARGKLDENAIENMIRLSNSISSQIRMTRDFRAEGGRSEFTIRMRYTGDRSLNNFIVHDKVPKTFAQDADNLTVNAPGAKVEIAEKDPEYVFLYETMSPEQEIMITYSVVKEVSTSVIDEAESFVYAEGYEGLPPGEVCTAGERRCEGNDLQECLQDGTGWRTLQTCGQGCDAERMACKEAPGGQPDAMAILMENLLWVILAVVVVIIVIAGVFLFKITKKKKHKFPNPMPQMRPSSLENR